MNVNNANNYGYMDTSEKTGVYLFGYSKLI